MLHYKADSLLLRCNILKYKLSLSISLMLLVYKTLAFVKSTLRSQITTYEASLPWSQVTFPTIRLSSYWGANVFTKKAALAFTPCHAFTGCDTVNISRRPKRKHLEHLDQLLCSRLVQSPPEPTGVVCVNSWAHTPSTWYCQRSQKYSSFFDVAWIT